MDEKKMLRLTKEQSDAVSLKSPFLAVTAGAGSGKTLVLVERFKNILDKKEANIDEILTITFTEKAAGELKQRIFERTGDISSIINANIGTFHSFCSRLLKEHAPLIGIDPDFKVLEEHAAGIFVRKAVRETLLDLLEKDNSSAILLVEEMEFRYAGACLEELISFRWHANKAFSFDYPPETSKMDKREGDLRRVLFDCFSEALKRYGSLKSSALDFHDLEIFALNLLKLDEIRQSYQRRFKYILVDEFQDVNDTQAELISLLYHKNKNNLTIVGDPKQSIYRFRGANVHQFDTTSKKASNLIRIKENFRSTSGIIDFVNKTFPNFEPLRPGRGEDLSPSVYSLTILSDDDSNSDAQRLKEAQKIREIIGSLSGTTACLFYSLKDVEIYSKALSDIPHVISGGGGFLEQKDVIDIINFLRISADKTNLPALLGASRSPYIGMTDEEIFTLAPLTYEKIGDTQKGEILKRIAAAKEHLGISELIYFIVGERLTDNIDKLAHLAEIAEERENISLNDFVEYLEEIKRRGTNIAPFPSSSGEDSLNLMTIHQAKGLEFDNVIICDLIRKTDYKTKRWLFTKGRSGTESMVAFKLVPEENSEADPEPTTLFNTVHESDKTEEGEEHERLLYVAMTRAKQKLILPIHPGFTKDGKWHRQLIFANAKYNIPEYEFRNSGGQTPPRWRAGTMGEKAPERLTAGRGRIFTVSELETYEKSPNEYYLKYILKSPGSLFTVFKNGLSPSMRGDIIHRMIEYSFKERTLASEKLLKNILVEFELPFVPDQERKEILLQFNQYLASAYSKAKNAQNEVQFITPIGGDFVKGKIDMLIISEDRKSWEIVDFKTGISTDPTKALREYDLQIHTYAHAVANVEKIYKGFATLLFLTNDSATSHSIEIGEKSLAGIEKRLLGIITTLRTSSHAFPALPYNERKGQ